MCKMINKLDRIIVDIKFIISSDVCKTEEWLRVLAAAEAYSMRDDDYARVVCGRIL